jgi:hypothetical protein
MRVDGSREIDVRRIELLEPNDIRISRIENNAIAPENEGRVVIGDVGPRAPGEERETLGQESTGFAGPSGARRRGEFAVDGVESGFELAGWIQRRLSRVVGDL